MKFLKSEHICPILAGIFVYTVLGYFFIATGTTIYDDINLNNISVNDNEEFDVYFRVNNEAILSFPYVNPISFMDVNIENQTSKCYMTTLSGEIECQERTLALDFIEINNPKGIQFHIKPNGDFNLSVKVYIDAIIMRIKSASVRFECKEIVDGTFSCQRF